MPTLNWIGKDAVVNHHKEVPFRLLKYNEKLSVGSLRLSGEGRGDEVGFQEPINTYDISKAMMHLNLSARAYHWCQSINILAPPKQTLPLFQPDI